MNSAVANEASRLKQKAYLVPDTKGKSDAM